MKTAALEKKINVSEFGTITKREFMNKAKAAGWTVEAKLLNGYQSGRFNRIKYNRLSGEEQTHYEKSLEVKRMEYSVIIAGTNSSYNISKTEYDYFLTLAN